jgi:hypothetical protein
MSLLLDLLVDVSSVAQKLCPGWFAAEAAPDSDDLIGSLDKSALTGVRSSSPGPSPQFIGNGFKSST